MSRLRHKCSIVGFYPFFYVIIELVLCVLLCVFVSASDSDVLYACHDIGVYILDALKQRPATINSGAGGLTQ